MLQNEPGQNPEVESVDNDVDEMEVIYHTKICPHCWDGEVRCESIMGETWWEVCYFCHGLGHLPILEG